jgi:hypothetical protein
MNDREAHQLAEELVKKYGEAIRTFVDLKGREQSGRRIAGFANALGVGPNPDVPKLAKALVEEFHEKDRDRQVMGFSDGVRWAFEALIERGVIKQTT